MGPSLASDDALRDMCASPSLRGHGVGAIAREARLQAEPAPEHQAMVGSTGAVRVPGGLEGRCVDTGDRKRVLRWREIAQPGGNWHAEALFGPGKNRFAEQRRHPALQEIFALALAILEARRQTP